MAIAATKPSVPPDPDDTIVGQECIFAFEPEGGTQENIRAKIAGFSVSVEKLPRKSPNATSGILEKDRTVITGIERQLRLTFDEFNAATMAVINNAYRKGAGRLWILDPDDATDTAALLSNEFQCTVSPDGEISFQADQFSEGSIMVDINGAFTLTANGAIGA